MNDSAGAMKKCKHVCCVRGRGHNSAYAQRMSVLCGKFQISASNTVIGDVATRTIIQCNMVKICHSRGHNSAMMIWIKILFPLGICSVHI